MSINVWVVTALLTVVSSDTRHIIIGVKRAWKRYRWAIFRYAAHEAIFVVSISMSANILQYFLAINYRPKERKYYLNVGGLLLLGHCCAGDDVKQDI